MKIGNVECYGVIYKITNIINNKCYIGQTTIGFDKRYTNDICKYTHNKHLKNAIKKYSLESFEIIKIFDIAFSKIELDIKEKHYIQLFDSFNNGYNETLGGEGKVGFMTSKETIEKQRQARKQWWNNLTDEEYKKWYEKLYITKGENNPMYGVHKYGKDNPFYGKHHSEETKRKHSLDVSGENNYWYNKKGKKSPNKKSVICLTTKKIFYTAKEAGDYYNIDKGNIGKCCQGKYKSAGKYNGKKLVWKYLIWNHNKKFRKNK